VSPQGTIVEKVRPFVEQVAADLGLQVYDLEHAGGILRVTIDRDGGVDLEAIADVTRMVSRELDHLDPFPGHYTLEVTSPGLERPLRTPTHFRGAIGITVSVRTHPHVEGDRRAHGTLVAADDNTIIVRLDEGDQERVLRYGDIERARTVFVWGPAATNPKPGKSRRSGAAPTTTRKAAT
jgi:ribosome maturation factor RimP